VVFSKLLLFTLLNVLVYRPTLPIIIATRNNLQIEPILLQLYSKNLGVYGCTDTSRPHFL